MDFEFYKAKYLEKLLQGDRIGCRNILGETLQTGTPANTIYSNLFWPVMVEIETLYRHHRIDRITEHMATRINRTLVDQLQSKLPRSKPNNKKIVITCAHDEPEELGAQMCADLFESEGWEVKFIGGGVPNDEVIEMVGHFRPDVLFVYGTKPSGAPDVRRLMDTIRRINSCPDIKIMLSGGVFNRAEGLWEEIGADLFAPTARDALKVAHMDSQQESAPKRRQRRTRKSVLQEEAQLA